MAERLNPNEVALKLGINIPAVKPASVKVQKIRGNTCRLTMVFEFDADLAAEDGRNTTLPENALYAKLPTGEEIYDSHSLNVTQDGDAIAFTALVKTSIKKGTSAA